MSHFSFLCPTKTSVGKNALAHLPFDIYAMGRTKPMVIQDHPGRNAKPLITAFKESGMTLGIPPTLPDAGEEESLKFIRSVYDIYTRKGYDTIVALGGEKAADAAKALNLAVTLGPEALKQDEINRPLSPFLYLPTGVETGSATTGRLWFNQRRFASPHLAPDQVVVDPALFIADDRSTLLDAALNCLAAGCEVFALSGNPPAKAYAAAVIRLVVHPLNRLLASGLDPDQNLGQKKKDEKKWQKDIVHASVLSGYLAASPSLVRAAGEKLAKASRIRQGQAMLVVLPSILETLGSKDLAGLLFPLSGPERFSCVPAPQRPGAAIQAIRALVNELHLKSGGRRPRTLAEAGWNEAALKPLGQELSESGRIPYVDSKTLDTVFTHACSGRPVIKA